jgi:8-oxo-dGTP diphosphatase
LGEETIIERGILMIIAENNFGYQFLEFMELKEAELVKFKPLSGSFVIAKSGDRFLLCFNKHRNQWELPAGKREEGESPRKCATRELYEETTQIIDQLEFKGLMKLKNTQNGEIKNNPVYYGSLNELQPFIENEETSEIILWNQNDDIGYIDEIDKKLLKLF